VNNSDEVIRNTGAIVQKGSGEWESRVFQQAKNGVFQCNFMYICCISTVSTTYPLIIYHLATVNNNFVARLWFCNAKKNNFLVNQAVNQSVNQKHLFSAIYCERIIGE